MFLLILFTSGMLSVLRYLDPLGIDLGTTDGNNDTPYSVATAMEHNNVVHFLQEISHREEGT